MTVLTVILIALFLTIMVLVRLDDHAFQNKMKELDEHFQKLQYPVQGKEWGERNPDHCNDRTVGKRK